MRTLSIAVVLFAAACTPVDPGELELKHRSSLGMQTRGVALNEGGNTGQAGMFDMTCGIETRYGGLTGDYDVKGRNDTVVDVLGPDALIKSNDTLTVVDWNGETAMTLPGLKDARFLDHHIVATRDTQQGCEVVFIGASGADASQTLPTTCGTLDHGPDGSVIVSGDDVTVVTPDGTTAVGETADLAVWDEHTQAIYVADLGTDEVRALEVDGTQRWVTRVDGAITAMAPAGEQHAALVSIERDGRGAVLALDGYTGSQRMDMPTPASAPALTVSGNGAVVGIILPTDVHFFELTLSD